MGELTMPRYHAHVYFDSEQRSAASQLHQELAARFPVWVSGLVDKPVGPHPLPMFQVIFDENQFGPLLSWLIGNRQGLDVLVHQDTGDELSDHTDHVMWLGRSHRLNLHALI